MLNARFSHAEDFIAATLGDYGNVTVMEVTGGYDAKNPDGTLNSIPRETIAKEFLSTHKDEYDFLVIFSNFDFRMPDTEAKAFYLTVKNDTKGIGQNLFDNSAFFGSNGKLQGTIDMGNIAKLVMNPLDPAFDFTLDTISHEMMHRWGAYVRFKNPDGSLNNGLLGKDGSHWSFLLSTDASLMYGNTWQDNGNGTFTSIRARKYYSSLDLYLMGFIDKSRVPPMLLIENLSVDPSRSSEAGVTISGTPRYITIDDIIAAEGERIPGSAESQKEFKTAFIFITAPGAFTGDELYGLEAVRNGWLTRYSVLTDGAGLVQVASTLREDIPVNPGVIPPQSTVRSLPPNIEDGVRWLMGSQKPEGIWMDSIQTSERDTAETVIALKNFDIARQNYTLGLQWLNNVYPSNNDFLSRKIGTLSASGEDISSLLNELLTGLNLNGGWGIAEGYGSAPFDTSLALKYFAKTGYSNTAEISKAIENLKASRNSDGGWGDDESSTVSATANVLTAFNKYRKDFPLEDQISSGLAWLTQRQNPDGGFGNSPSTVYDTATAVMTLREFDVPPDVTNKALNYILNLQSENGSWYESPYQTALAIEAVWNATVEPDLSIKNTDISFIPSVITSLPSNVVINANIWNLGRTSVPQAKVALYEGAIAEANKIGEQTVAFPGQSSVTVTFPVTVRDGDEHRFYVVVDPENLVIEPNEANNTALQILYPQSTYDFEILPSDISVSANTVDIFKDVKITSKITNKGTMNAYNVKIKYFIDEAGTPFDIATSTVDVPAGAAITNEVTWRTNKAGVNLPLTVFADPFNTFAELSEENNKATTTITVNSSTEPNLTIFYKDIVITPVSVNEKGNANISVLVKNEGFSAATDIQVNFYKGVPGVDGELLGSRTIQTLNTGESKSVSVDWMNIMDAGERIMYIKVDPDNLIKEISEDDNDAFVVLDILSLPDLAISASSIVLTPSAPKDGDTVSVNVTIKNLGRQNANSVSVKAYEGNTVIGVQSLPLITGDSQANTVFAYDSAGKSGAHNITVVIDPDNTIAEQSEDNNSATKSFGVQDADLWLTELYISPNGDGIKDSTQFFFRLDTQQTVKVVVVNKKGETVRTFSRTELENVTGGNIAWDGLNDDGMVVDDGQYQIRIVDVNNNVPGSLLVTVDNNRSPLTDAVGTKYLLNSNLTCSLPYLYDDKWDWLPDESGIVFSIQITDQAFPEYPNGVYIMSPNGADITRITPNDWTDNNTVTKYYYFQHYISPDGEKIAIKFWKYDYPTYKWTKEIWLTDIDGSNLRMLLQENNDSIYDLKWSPDGKYILYNLGPVNNNSGYFAYELWILNVEDLSKTKIDWGYRTLELISTEWSPDGAEIAYLGAPSYDGNMDTDALKISDLRGNKRTIFLFNNYSWWVPIHWLGNNKIITEHPSMNPQLWLFDASGNGNHIKLSDKYDKYKYNVKISISPDRQSFTFITSDNSGAQLNISDTTGNAYVFHELKTTGMYCVPEISGTVWSPDSRKIYFSERFETCGDCPMECIDPNSTHGIIADMETDKILTVEKYIEPIAWFSDGVFVAGMSDVINVENANINVINTNTGETKSVPTPPDTWVIWFDRSKFISPREHYITYYQRVDSSSACYGRGEVDLWAIGSLMNLTADLRAVKNRSAVVLKGIAADLNFEGYKLEYADVKNPNSWTLIAPPSDMPVFNDVFTAWVPPYEGTFYVRLTVWDKAGNVAMNRKRVSWGMASNITNLYRTQDVFSPNGDGVKDTVDIHYSILDEVHLDFKIIDENDNFVRLIHKDYTSPCNDFITWDGRDYSGSVVPDGTYKIRVSDYELTVETDNTPPDIDITVERVSEEVDYQLYAGLSGHVSDSRLKSWIIEYGEGENPLVWFKLAEGQDNLVKTDKNGQPLNPVQDTHLYQYWSISSKIYQDELSRIGTLAAFNNIEDMINKKYRITAEDLGGNKRSKISPFLPEQIAIYGVENKFVLHDKVDLYDFDLRRADQYVMHALETVRENITSLTVQYKYGSDFYADEFVEQKKDVNQLCGTIKKEGFELGTIKAPENTIAWLNEILQLPDLYERITLKKSNLTLTGEITEMLEQTEKDRMSLFQDLKIDEQFAIMKLNRLLIELIFPNETPIHISAAGAWHDAATYSDFPENRGLLEGIPLVGIPWELLKQLYIIRLKTVDYSGNEIYSNEVQFEVLRRPSSEMIINCSTIFSARIEHIDAECGHISGKAKIIYNGNKVFPVTLTNYIQYPDGVRLLAEIDPAQMDYLGDGFSYDLNIDTTSMVEGDYPITVILTYYDECNKEPRDQLETNSLLLTLHVDRSLPETVITYPTESLLTCAVRTPSLKGVWDGVTIKGLAKDNIELDSYALYYAEDAAPAKWIAAVTRDSAGFKHLFKGEGKIEGQIGVWDVTDLGGTSYSLRLAATDIAGNTSCGTTSFILQKKPEIRRLSLDKKIFSPNGDGLIDQVEAAFQVVGDSTLDVRVYRLYGTTDGSYLPSTTPVRTIISGVKNTGYVEAEMWDGKNDLLKFVPDGMYGVSVFAKDSCGNDVMKWVAVEVDNTPPATIITYPSPPDTLGNIVEVKGSAEDLHFRNYILEAGQGDNPESWSLISSNTTPVKNSILGRWNTFGFEGRWTLRLIATDTLENRGNTTVTVDLGMRKDLIKDLDTNPGLFSPNNDGKLDTTNIKYELTDACNVKIEMLDSGNTVRNTYTTTAPSAGIYTYAWDGKDNAGAVVSDGGYTVRLTAGLSSNTSVNQTETITVIVDATSPTVDIRQPANNSYIKTDITVNGTISDINMAEYSISYTGNSGTVFLDAANQNREDYTFGIVNNLSEGNYTLNAKARDIGENTAEKNIAFTIDRTPPKVALDMPKDGELYGNKKNLISITGSILEKNLDTYSLRYGSGDNPVQWIDLQTGNTIPVSPDLLAWKVGKTDGIPDGIYTLSLYARDKAELTGETKVKVIIDNTPPEVSITLPEDGGYIKTAAEVRGTAFDTNMEKYTLELSEGNCSAAFKWAPLKAGAVSVRDGSLALLQALPTDGDYCLKLSALDKVENRAETRSNIKIDTHPPAAPELTGKLENNSSARLTWTQNSEPDVAGYDLYRDGLKINATLIPDATYLDRNQKEGVYVYTVKSVDFAGWESGPSNEVRLRIDFTGPEARIRSPQDSSRVNGIIDIKGTAYSDDDFKEYRVYLGNGSNPSTWNLIRTSPVPIPYGVLAEWDTINLPAGENSIKLETEDLSGNTNSHQITVIVDDVPPAAPVLTSAADSGSNVTIMWNANTEADLLGYLLYRNDRLANAPSNVALGDLKPYLVTCTAYIDKSLPDGSFTYYIFAVDQAGNISDQSNSIDVGIDTHAPRATITEPADASKFESAILIKAESADLDLASVQFQYKRATDTVWVNAGSSVTAQPYSIYLDPAASGFEYGDYDLRVTATDKGDNTDSSPPAITVTYTDITRPTAPSNLRAVTTGMNVTLTWTANTEADLEGYNIYNVTGTTKTKLNAFPIKAAIYEFTGLADGIYSYEITAVDSYQNESKPSNNALARVYVPLIEQPYTPTSQKTLQLKGGNATANSAVEIYVDTGSGPVSQGAAAADVSGDFTSNTALAPGENRITAKATDADGNTSRVSDMVVVVYNETPLPPTGLQATINNHEVGLTWNPNAETDLSGYNLFRGDEKLNAPVSVTSGNATASSYDYINPPSNALDSDPNTSWMSGYSYDVFNPEWLQIDLPSPELINHMEINWQSDSYAGKDYEIQFWSGYAWITQEKVTGNNELVNIFDFKPSYRTDRIRIYITGATGVDYYKQVGIFGISVLRDDLITGTSYSDLSLSDGKYSYKITAVDYYGFESLPSDITAADVGDVMPPSSPSDLTPTVSGADIILNWSSVTDPDLTGYNVYRNTPQGWIKLNTTLVPANTYTDPGLLNGAYTYRVTAVDLVGNESLPSNEATATVYIADTVQPSKPVLFFPTTAGIPVVVHNNRTDVSGFAEPASKVELFKNGVSSGTATALGNDLAQTYTVEPAYEVSLSPDGKTLAYYSYDGSLRIKPLGAGQSTLIIQNGYSPVWSPDGSKLAYVFDDINSYYRIGIYDPATGLNTPLTNDADVYEEIPSWSSDGSMLSFISNRGGQYDVWVKDLFSGSLIQATSGVNPSNARLSPDGKRLAYFDGQNLFSMDLLSGATTLADNNTDSYSLDWSPDSIRLLFISFINGSGNLYAYDLYAGSRTQLTNLSNDKFNPVWSPDGNSVLYARYEADSTNSILALSLGEPGSERQIQQGLNLNYLAWIKKGTIAYLDQNILTAVYPKGHFNFEDMHLDPGENIFLASSSDASGNLSQPSDGISMIFDPGLLPDLVAAPDDIYIYPAVPVTGQQIAINAVIWNRGQAEAKDVEADVYIWDSAGNLELVKSVNIPSIASGSAEIIGFAWDTTGKIGANRIIVVIDPQDNIPEQSETNNYAEKDFYVVQQEGILMTTTLNSDVFSTGQDVDIDTTIINSGPEKDGLLTISIEDGGGHPVALLYSANMHLPYGTTGKRLIWNTGTTYEGPYTARAVLKNESGISAENLAPFTILPDINIGSSIITDRFSYGPNEDVTVTFSVKNNGLNYIVPTLKARVRITDLSNNNMMTADRDIANLLPGSAAASDYIWDTSLHMPGDYRAVIEIYLNDRLISTKAALFRIEPVFIISGSLKVTPSVVPLGCNVITDYTIKNTGNSAVSGLGVKVLIIDPETQTVMNNGEETIDLAMNNNRAGQYTFSTQGYGLKTYMAVLQYAYQDDAKTLASASFTVIDVTPPAVTIISPVSGSLFNSGFAMSIISTDDASGVNNVEYRVDSGIWKPLPVSDPSTGRYSLQWTPVLADEGTHTISFRATDKVGNTSVPVSTTITIEVISGALTAQPNPVEQGNDENITYSITSTASENITGLSVNVLVIDPDTGSIKQTLESVVDVPVNTTMTGNFILPAASLVPKTYRVILKVSSPVMVHPKDLASTLFEVKAIVKPSLEVTKKIPGLTNLLVWVNGKCREQEDDHDKDDDHGSGHIFHDKGEVKDGHDNDQRKDRKDRRQVKEITHGYSKDRDEHPEEDRDEDYKDGDKEDEGKDGDNDGKDEEDRGCLRLDLLVRILRDATTSCLIVYDKKDFQTELRNPYYTDILILGNQYPIEDHYREELRERINSGSGLISSLWLKHGNNDNYTTEDPMLGVKHKGRLAGERHTVWTVQSPITEAGSVSTKGIAERIETISGAVVAGWFESGTCTGHHDGDDDHEDCRGYDSKDDRDVACRGDGYNDRGDDHENGGHNSSEEYPAIVLNNYGNGKSVFYSFDFGLTLDDINYDRLSALIKKSLFYVHNSSDNDTFYAGSLVPVELRFKSLGGSFDLKATESYPEAIKLYDPVQGIWVNDNPWSNLLHLGPDETGTILYYALIPDKAGAFTLRTDTSYLENGTYTLYNTLTLDIVVDKDLKASAAAVMDALNTLNSGEKRQSEGLRNAKRYIQDVQARSVATKNDIEKNIRDILSAIDCILRLNADALQVRSVMDELLKGWESRYYYGF